MLYSNNNLTTISPLGCPALLFPPLCLSSSATYLTRKQALHVLVYIIELYSAVYLILIPQGRAKCIPFRHSNRF